MAITQNVRKTHGRRVNYLILLSISLWILRNTAAANLQLPYLIVTLIVIDAVNAFLFKQRMKRSKTNYIVTSFYIAQLAGDLWDTNSSVIVPLVPSRLHVFLCNSN